MRTDVGGFTIPKRSVVTISPYVTHRHPSFWDDPERFDPERFTPERIRSRPRFAYLPFSGGPRLCIGNEFALMEAQLVLAMTVQRYRLRLVPGTRVEARVASHAATARRTPDDGQRDRVAAGRRPSADSATRSRHAAHPCRDV